VTKWGVSSQALLCDCDCSIRNIVRSNVNGFCLDSSPGKIELIQDKDHVNVDKSSEEPIRKHVIHIMQTQFHGCFLLET
jgi:hypothetical protein